MTDIEDIMSSTSHRPFALPASPWKFYQEWKDVLFFHWTTPFDVIRKCVPEKFNVDTFEGTCYVSLLAFTMQKVRPRYLPSISFISDFHEINLRTYIDNDHKKGIYFLNIEAGKLLSAFVTRTLSGLPYEKATIKRTDNTYTSTNSKKGLYLDTEFEIKQPLAYKSRLDKWLTERYCLYLDKGDDFLRYDVHHKEWNLRKVEIKRLSLGYKVGEIDLAHIKSVLTHYSEGVKVLVWQPEKVEK